MQRRGLSCSGHGRKATVKGKERCCGHNCSSSTVSGEVLPALGSLLFFVFVFLFWFVLFVLEEAEASKEKPGRKRIQRSLLTCGSPQNHWPPLPFHSPPVPQGGLGAPCSARPHSVFSIHISCGMRHRGVVKLAQGHSVNILWSLDLNSVCFQDLCCNTSLHSLCQCENPLP